MHVRVYTSVRCEHARECVCECESVFMMQTVCLHPLGPGSLTHLRPTRPPAVRRGDGDTVSLPPLSPVAYASCFLGWGGQGISGPNLPRSRSSISLHRLGLLAHSRAPAWCCTQQYPPRLCRGGLVFWNVCETQGRGFFLKREISVTGCFVFGAVFLKFKM